MVKAGRWLRSILTGKKEGRRGREKETENMTWLALPPPPPPPPTTPKGEKSSSEEETARRNPPATRASFGKAATRTALFGTTEHTAAVKIQSFFRSFLARKALRALKGLVKLQAVVRGFLVRKQAAATLRRLQALLTAQARARAQRAQLSEEARPLPWRKTTIEYKLNQFHEITSCFQETCNPKSPNSGTNARRDFALGHPKASPSRKLRRVPSAEQILGQESPFAKARSQSTPRRMLFQSEKQPSRHTTPFEGRSFTRAATSRDTGELAGHYRFVAA
ncbi:hypothetical protein HPP92_001913 [Vanilla planifolia]|uniref:DUF4005 domain-containing protein n=1 Tax=Vanilla planifolia TaxID=51239 RepID=A0A835S566_VANPL|nr:hypothetical protein HPP92_001913 [Vanilla planifolia]